MERHGKILMPTESVGELEWKESQEDDHLVGHLIRRCIPDAARHHGPGRQEKSHDFYSEVHQEPGDGKQANKVAVQWVLVQR